MRQMDPIARLKTLCAKSEKSTSDIRRSLMRWNIERSEWTAIIAELTAEKFIDDRRYAAAYVRDKLNFSRWGAAKIRQGLYAKQIAPDIIAEAMAQVDPSQMTEKLEYALKNKAKTVKSTSDYDLKMKLIRFGCSRGYSYDEVSDAVEKILG